MILFLHQIKSFLRKYASGLPRSCSAYDNVNQNIPNAHKKKADASFLCTIL
ncbi:hypothetical protein FM120_21290 [Sphingobacterium faecium PCAi_F2.5]|nr:hypothetical protein FM120_21290 [Sphingobacterium faecium PCAi_F2.5]